MKRIELDIWEPSPDKVGVVVRVGGRTAQEVFAELEQRLESTGYLPDEYFLLGSDWENGREIPKDADIFCTTDYGGNEGIYIDVYMKWHEDGKAVTKSFATGKTLGESESDLDRMFLISSAITKAFHSDGVHARYVQVGEAGKTENAVLHLNEEEQRTLINSLVESRNRLKEETQAVEQLLRRVTGSITEFVNEVGDRPLKINDFDKAVLAIQDGNIDAFNDVFFCVPDKYGELLQITAERSGNVGKTMTDILLMGVNGISNEVYLNACKNAIATGDTERVLTLAEKAEHCIADLDMKLYGELISDAMLNNKNHIAKAVLKQCTPDQIKAANPHLFIQAIWNKSNMEYDLAAKGIDANSIAYDVIRALANNHREYSFGTLLGNGLNISADNYSALRSCVQNNSVEMGKELLDRGMDFDGYMEWCETNEIVDNSGETFDALKGYWENMINVEQDDGIGQSMGGM